MGDFHQREAKTKQKVAWPFRERISHYWCGRTIKVLCEKMKRRRNEFQAFGETAGSASPCLAPAPETSWHPCRWRCLPDCRTLRYVTRCSLTLPCRKGSPRFLVTSLPSPGILPNVRGDAECSSPQIRLDTA